MNNFASLDLYNNVAKSQTISPRFKVEILSQEDYSLGEITDDIIDGSISVNYNQGVRRSCSITFSDPNGIYIPKPFGIFWIGKKFKIYIGLEYSKNYFENSPMIYADNISSTIALSQQDNLVYSGLTINEEKDIIWFAQGVFYVNNPDSNRDFSNITTTISGVDKFGYLGNELGYNQLEGTYLIKQGTRGNNAVKDILMLDTGNGYVIDPLEPLITEKLNEIIPFDIKRSPGDYIGNILKDIANIFGCNIFYDENGRLNVTDGTTDVSYSQEAIIWEFTDVLPEYFKSSIGFDFAKAINIVKVVGTNVHLGIFEYTAENRNPLSNTTIDLIGKKILYLESENIFNADRAKDLAIYTLNKESIVPIMLSFSCSMLPHLNVDKIVGITDKYYNYERQRFIIQSLTIPLNAKDSISVSASNLASLPYYEMKSGV